jgi:hypothetical protein
MCSGYMRWMFSPERASFKGIRHSFLPMIDCGWPLRIWSRERRHRSAFSINLTGKAECWVAGRRLTRFLTRMMSVWRHSGCGYWLAKCRGLLPASGCSSFDTSSSVSLQSKEAKPIDLPRCVRVHSCRLLRHSGKLAATTAERRTLA